MTRSCHSERSEESETDKNRNRMFNKLYKMKKIEGKLSAQGQRIGIVAARFNEFITSKLLSGAEDSFVRHGGNTDDLEVAWVPGSFEIPLVMTLSYASELSFAVRPRISIWWLTRLQKALPR